MPERISIPARFRGPPDSGNGGYVCGVVAGLMEPAEGRAAEVTLRQPPPLEVPLTVERSDAGVRLAGDGGVVAEGAAVDGDLGITVPPPVDVVTATEASSAYPGFMGHPFPTCFTCGPDRQPGDGLRIFPGPVGAGVWAAPWTPDRALTSGDEVPEAVVWAALDCPSGHAVIDHAAGMVCVLGRLAAVVLRPVPVGAPVVAMAWPRPIDGRKRHSASALLDADGDVLAVARATWIQLEVPPPGGVRG